MSQSVNRAVNHTASTRPRFARLFAIFTIVFGVMTLISGGSVLFGPDQARLDAGSYVPFVLWFNFGAGFAYILAGIGLFIWRQWATALAALIALSTLLVSAAFAFHIWQGGAYEMRTVGAMVLRSAVWITIAAYTRAAWNKVNAAPVI